MKINTEEISSQSKIFNQFKRGAITRVAKQMGIKNSLLSMNIKRGKNMKISTAEKIIEAIKKTEGIEIPLLEFLGKNK